jgi:hypothetical protein
MLCVEESVNTGHPSPFTFISYLPTQFKMAALNAIRIPFYCGSISAPRHTKISLIRPQFFVREV